MPPDALNILVRIDPARARRWHAHALEILSAKGHRLRLELAYPRQEVPFVIRLLTMLERLLRPQSASQPGAEWQPTPTHGPSQGPCDLTVDLTSNRDAPPSSGRWLKVLYGGGTFEEACYLDLLNGAGSIAGFQDSAAPEAPRLARIAVRNPTMLSIGWDEICERLTSFLVDAVQDVAEGRRVTGRLPIPREARAWSVSDTLTALQARATTAIGRIAVRAAHWHVGWRHAASDLIKDTLAMPKATWSRLPDDGQRYYADPFVMSQDGRTWVFLEEFPFA
ncbi:MAG TPA: hypothetical protein DCL48_13170, partial [Alphaproteobacteria bacterium]|nr:hypothetical protein [Alphaproteobacteria bacterium]